MRFLILILFIGGLAFSAGAQVNTEKDRLRLEKDGFSGSAEFSYDIQRGNSHLTEVALTPHLIYRTGRHVVFTINNLSFVSSEGQDDIVNEGFSHWRYNYKITSRYIWEVFTQAQFDETQLLSERYLFGSGLRIVIQQREHRLAAVGLTAMYEYEALDTDEITRLVRGSVYLSVGIARKDRFSFTSTTYVQPALEDFSDTRLLNQTALSFVVFKGFSFTTSLDLRYDSEPPAELEKYDLELKNGVKISF